MAVKCLFSVESVSEKWNILNKKREIRNNEE